MTIETDAVTLAEAKLSELEARLVRAREQASSNRTKAHQLAFAAEGQDDDTAKRTARKLLDDAAKLDDDATHRLGPAVDEAKRLVAEAKTAAAEAAKLQDASEALALAPSLETLGADMDAALAALLEAKRKAFDVLDRLTAIGAGAPSVDNASVIVRRQIEDAFRRAGLVSDRPEFLPPLQRRPFKALFGGWGAATASRSAKRVGSDQKREAA